MRRLSSRKPPLFVEVTPTAFFWERLTHSHGTVDFRGFRKSLPAGNSFPQQFLPHAHIPNPSAVTTKGEFLTQIFGDPSTNTLGTTPHITPAPSRYYKKPPGPPSNIPLLPLVFSSSFVCFAPLSRPTTPVKSLTLGLHQTLAFL